MLLTKVRIVFTFLLLCLALSLLPSFVRAQQFSRILSFQGRLCGTDGKPLPDGRYSVTFSFYFVETGGTALWQETQNVTQVGGVFTVHLGSVTAFPAGLFDKGDLWLGIKVGADPEMAPRFQLRPSPWAIRSADANRADNADRADGFHASAKPTPNYILPLDAEGKFPRSVIPFSEGWSLWGNEGTTPPGNFLGTTDYKALVFKTNNTEAMRIESTGYVGIGRQPSWYWRLAVENPSGGGACFSATGTGGGDQYALGGIAAKGTGTNHGVWGEAADGQYNFGLKGYAHGGGANYGVAGVSEGGTDSAIGVYGSAQRAARNWAGYFEGNGYFSGNVGIGTTTPGHPLTFPDTLGDKISLWGQSGNHHGFGVQWQQLQFIVPGAGDNFTFGYGRSDAFTEVMRVKGNGKVGIGTASPTSALTVLDYDRTQPALSVTTTAADDSDTPSILGVNAVVDLYGLGVEGVGGHTGVRGTGGRIGVEASVSAAGYNSYYGVMSQVYGGQGANYGVYVVAGSNDFNCGLHAEAIGGTDAYGVYGAAWGATEDNYAGLFDGDVRVTGWLSKGGGSFKIDHPLDPENKYLSHSFVESPDMMNIYNGNVVTDERGYATVTLPDWFEALNRDFRYQLTVLDDGNTDQFVSAKVVGKMADNQFMIRTSAPCVEVSWQVTGVRQDPYANLHRIQVEEDKSAEDRGKYLHPDAYGQPEEKGIAYLHRPGPPAR